MWASPHPAFDQQLAEIPGGGQGEQASWLLAALPAGDG